MIFKLLLQTLVRIGIMAFVKSLRFNIKYFGFNKGVHLPVLISKNVLLNKNFGSIILPDFTTGIVKIGFGNVGIFDKKYDRTVLEFCENSTIEFKGSASIGHGTKISVQLNAKLVIGDNFCITANSSIICANKIEFGDNCLMSWDVLVMDSDLHKILDDNSTVINPPKSVCIGDNVWIGAKVTILKGTVVGSDNVIGANSLVTGIFNETNVVIAGSPARIVKRNIKWTR